MRDPFGKLITEASLAKLAGEKSRARGAAYFAAGAAADLLQTRGAIKARVMGSDEYRVELYSERGRLAISCTCPIGQEGEFCKHAVATGLAWLARGEGGDDLADVRAHLEAASRESLVERLRGLSRHGGVRRARERCGGSPTRPPRIYSVLYDGILTVAEPATFVPCVD